MNNSGNEKDFIPTVQWVQWLSATVVAAAVLVSFMYTNFATKAEADIQRFSIEKRLDRLEQKIDQLVDRTSSKR